MTMPIGKTLKGLSLAAILLAVPAFAVFGLMANASHRSSVQLSAEHDPLRSGFGMAQTRSARGEQRVADKTTDESELSDWSFTSKPVPSPYTKPLPAGYPIVP